MAGSTLSWLPAIGRDGQGKLHFTSKGKEAILAVFQALDSDGSQGLGYPEMCRYFHLTENANLTREVYDSLGLPNTSSGEVSSEGFLKMYQTCYEEDFELGESRLHADLCLFGLERMLQAPDATMLLMKQNSQTATTTKKRKSTGKQPQQAPKLAKRNGRVQPTSQLALGLRRDQTVDLTDSQAESSIKDVSSSETRATIELDQESQAALDLTKTTEVNQNLNLNQNQPAQTAKLHPFFNVTQQRRQEHLVKEQLERDQFKNAIRPAILSLPIHETFPVLWQTPLACKLKRAPCVHPPPRIDPPVAQVPSTITDETWERLHAAPLIELEESPDEIIDLVPPSSVEAQCLLSEKHSPTTGSDFLVGLNESQVEGLREWMMSWLTDRSHEDSDCSQYKDEDDLSLAWGNTEDQVKGPMKGAILHGDIGSGKTCLVYALAAELG